MFLKQYYNNRRRKIGTLVLPTKKEKEKEVIPLIYKTFYMSNLIILGGKKEKVSYVVILNYHGNFKEILMKPECWFLNLFNIVQNIMVDF